MIKTVVWIWVAVICSIASTASAQAVIPVHEKQYFVDLAAGLQLGHHSVDSRLTFPLYDETAVFSGSQTTAHGAFVDLGIGYRFAPSVGVALAFSTFSSKTDAAVTAQIPDPAFFDTPHTVNATASELTRAERAAHLRVVWFIPVGDKFEVGLSGGPSIVKVSQDMPSGSIAMGTQNLTTAASTESKTGIGANAGLDATFVVTPTVGLGFAVHYVFASVDLPSVSGVKAGGLQTGVGLHLRF
jgi:hypothetical protein